MVIVCAKTDSAKGAHGVSLFLVEEGMAGFQKGKKLKKMGMKAQDTAELFFEDLRVPASAMLGPISPPLPTSPHLSPSLLRVPASAMLGTRDHPRSREITRPAAARVNGASSQLAPAVNRPREQGLLLRDAGAAAGAAAHRRHGCGGRRGGV